jgi:hypothetical protein
VNSLKAAIAALLEEYPDMKAQAPQAPTVPTSGAAGTNPGANRAGSTQARSWKDVEQMPWGGALTESRNKK